GAAAGGGRRALTCFPEPPRLSQARGTGGSPQHPPQAGLAALSPPPGNGCERAGDDAHPARHAVWRQQRPPGAGSPPAVTLHARAGAAAGAGEAAEAPLERGGDRLVYPARFPPLRRGAAMPAGVSWPTYLKTLGASVLAMFAGAEVVHRYYRPDLSIPEIPPKPGELRTELLGLKERSSHIQTSQQ
uniref:Chromosome 12 open reading frame 73 n=1 Tax=Apteryx owenii TaxID=8824 RepID=A0A8B9S3I1_APTOW